MQKLFDLLTNIKTPLALSGVFAGILFYVIKQILSEKNPQWKIDNTIIIHIINGLFITATIAMILGFLAFMFSPKSNNFVTLTFNIRNRLDSSGIDSVHVFIDNISPHPEAWSDDEGLVNLAFSNYMQVDSINLGFISSKHGISEFNKERIAIANQPPDKYFSLKDRIATSSIKSDSITIDTQNVITRNDEEFALRIKSMLYKVEFNSPLSTVLAFEFGESHENDIQYDQLPIAIECANDSIRYYWRYLNQSPLGQEVLSFLRTRKMNKEVSADSYFIYFFKDKKLIKIMLRIIPTGTNFASDFSNSLVEGTSFRAVQYNISKDKDLYYITGSSYYDHDYYEVLMCNEEGYNSCIHDWWHQ